jgi:hypothetical protein
MGIGLLILALWVKLIFIACLILLNLRRMRLAAKRKGSCTGKETAANTTDH